MLLAKNTIIMSHITEKNRELNRAVNGMHQQGNIISTCLNKQQSRSIIKIKYINKYFSFILNFFLF